jgi:ADP-ribosylglycohydrolase
MRAAPLAVAYAARADLVEAAVAESLITHADPRCALACAGFAAAIAAGIAGQNMFMAARPAIQAAAELLANAWSHEDEDVAAVRSAARELAEDLDAAQLIDPQLYGALHIHRTAGFVRVAFRLAFWHLVHTPSWKAALVDVASRGGDADTNAAIVGALLGARDGEAAIPAEWRARVLGATLPGSAAWAGAHHPRWLLS